ncbi:uncharacterized protein [Ambystoma mexicanum]|uniref:Antifreeze protein n=1 Tax=Ambystoma mexicanum TaxID=8296 RepID=I3QKR6_AMBME|nr:antifreeze protein [Ambystoma mexicanum]
MRTLLICVVAAAFLLQYAESQKRKSSGGLECHVCTDPRSCLKKNSVICKEGEMCIRMQRPAYNPSDKPESGDEYGTIGGMIAGRGCTTQQGCEKSKKVKLYKTTCCSTNLCNA